MGASSKFHCVTIQAEAFYWRQSLSGSLGRSNDFIGVIEFFNKSLTNTRQPFFLRRIRLIGVPELFQFFISVGAVLGPVSAFFWSVGGEGESIPYGLLEEELIPVPDEQIPYGLCEEKFLHLSFYGLYEEELIPFLHFLFFGLSKSSCIVTC